MSSGPVGQLPPTGLPQPTWDSLERTTELDMRDRPRTVEILLVEDNPDDIDLTREAIKEGKVRSNLSVTRDGVEAISFLRRKGNFASAPRPDLILLDLNLPKKDGREVLKEIKEDEDLRHIPVVVLTTSHADQDILKSYQLHANCYVTKPVDFDEFCDIVQSIEHFWFSVVNLPQIR